MPPDFDIASDSFWPAVAAALEATGMRRYELARKLGVSPAYVSDLLNGRRYGPDKIRRRVAEVLGEEGIEPCIEEEKPTEPVKPSEPTGPRPVFFRLGGGSITPVGYYPPPGANLADLGAIRVPDASMEPLLGERGIAIVNAGEREITSGGVYLVDLHDGGQALRRLVWVEKGRTLAMPFPLGLRPTEYARAREVKVLGRVVWAWREFR